MFVELEKSLLGTRRNIREVCDELGIDIPEDLTLNACTHCNVWSKRLLPDLDGYLVCKFCLDTYGA
jgi:hypothetical protein